MATDPFAFNPLETETHEAAHAVVAVALDAAVVEWISIGPDPSSPGAARVRFDRPIAEPTLGRAFQNLALAVVSAAGETSAVAVLGKQSRGHFASTKEDSAAVYVVTKAWHREDSARWCEVGSDVGSAASGTCRRHKAAIVAVAEILARDTRLEGDRFLEVARPHLTKEACAQSRADVAALLERLGA